MYAVIQVGGNQFQVSPGDRLLVDRLAQKIGDTVQFSPILVVDEKAVKLGVEAKNVTVEAKIVSHDLGQKLDIYRFRAKSRYRRHIGFRPQLTTLAIESIGKHTVSPVKRIVKKAKPA